MRDILNRVRGAVSTKDLVPVLTHFAFRDGVVAGFDGRLYIQAPLPKALRKLACTVDAAKFLLAVDACQGEPVLTLTDGKLVITRDQLTVRLPVGKVEDFVPAMPDAAAPKAAKRLPLLPALQRLLPFIGEDASRPWACGVLFSGTKAYATNNVVLVRTKLKQALPGKSTVGKGSSDVNLPRFAVEELLRIGEEPTGIGRSDHSLTFHYADGSWLRTTLFDVVWPKPPDELLKPLGELWPVAKDLAAAVALVQPFCPDEKNPIIVLDGDTVRTMDGVHSATVAGLKGALGHGAYRAEPLLTVLTVATHAAWGDFPRVHWLGPGLEGIMVGVAL